MSKLHRKVAIQVYFCKVAGENGKKLLPEVFLSYQKRISPMHVFIILQLSPNDFRMRTKGRKQKHSNKLKQIRYFNVINTAECWHEIGCTLCTSEPSLTKVEVRNFSVLHFPKWLCSVHGQVGISLRRVKRSVIFKCQCFCLLNIRQWSVLY